MQEDNGLLRGVNIMDGHVTHAGLAESRGYAFKHVDEILAEDN